MDGKAEIWKNLVPELLVTLIAVTSDTRVSLEAVGVGGGGGGK